MHCKYQHKTIANITFVVMPLNLKVFRDVEGAIPYEFERRSAFQTTIYL